MQRVAAAGAALLVLAAVYVASAPDPIEPGPGEARLEVDGRARVDRADGTTMTTEGVELLRPRDRVTAIEGSLRLVLPDDAVLEGRAGRNDVADTGVRIGHVPEVLTGEILAQAADGVTVAAAGNEITLEPGAGAMRVVRSLAVEARTYSGEVAFDSAGQQRAVPAYRRLSVSVVGSPPAKARPLLYDRADPWDRRFLGEIMELGDQLDAMADAYSQTARPGEMPVVDLLREVLPALDDDGELSPGLVASDRPVGETLVGAAITTFGRGGTFTQRWTSVFDFRGDGASWGLVAADQAVPFHPLLEAIEAALDASPFGFALYPPDGDLSIDELALGLTGAADIAAPTPVPGDRPGTDTDGTTAGDSPATGGSPGTSPAGTTTGPTTTTATSAPPASEPSPTLPPPTLPPPTLPPPTLPPPTLPLTVPAPTLPLDSPL